MHKNARPEGALSKRLAAGSGEEVGMLGVDGDVSPAGGAAGGAEDEVV